MIWQKAKMILGHRVGFVLLAEPLACAEPSAGPAQLRVKRALWPPLALASKC
jgi:hypothetical protein